jgi:DNA-binding PadR family transcriptional regulator
MSDDSIRLTGTSYAVLGLLDVYGDATPYDLKAALEKSIENFWPVPHTTFYAEPARLARAGYLSETQEAGGRRRKVYSLTSRGREALRAWVGAAGASPPQLRDEAMLKTFLGADPVPLARERAGWHRAKLDELEGYLREVRAAGGPESVETALVAGTAYHRALLEVIERLLAENAAG